MTAPDPEDRKSRTVRRGRRLTFAGLLLGVGLGGFFDGIVLHQILQWHHMLSSEGDFPVDTVAGLEKNTLADGLFHAATLLATTIGLVLFWKATRDGGQVSGRRLGGLMLAGWGIFNLVEGLIDHQILAVHHVNSDSVVLWDTLFLLAGALLLAGGLWLSRSGPEMARRD